MSRSRVIWKYKLTGPATTIELPSLAQVVAVGEQDYALVLWVLVDPSNQELFGRRFLAVSTGAEFHRLCDYLGTVQTDGGTWHVLEEPIGVEDV